MIHQQPRQKLSKTEKNTKWFSENLDFSESLLGFDSFHTKDYKNLMENYSLMVNEINPKNFQRFINPSKLNLDDFPAEFKHVGIGNAKISLLIGDYIARKQEYRVFISSNDSDGISRKEEGLHQELFTKIAKMIQDSSLSQNDLEMRMQRLQEWQTYDYQDIAEKTANIILNREAKEKNFDFLFTRTFTDLMYGGRQFVLADVLGGEPILERVHPAEVRLINNHDSMYAHDSEVMLRVHYLSVSKILDYYWDELTDKDRTKLEQANSLLIGSHTYGSTSPQLISHTGEVFGSGGGTNSDTIKLIPASMVENTVFGHSDGNGRIRVITAYWRGKRKIGKLTYLDENGLEQVDYVSEQYVPDEAKGEKVKYYWVNQWYQGTKIGADVYVKCEPVKHSAKSFTNLSSGLPPLIGVTASTHGGKILSIMDMMKPFDYAYDIAFWKREIEIASFKGSATAVNSALIPSGWSPDKWLQVATIDKIMYLDPTQEIMAGPNEGKSAGIFNNFVTQKVELGGSADSIQMLTDYMANIEYTMGKISGVQGAREGEVGERTAVRNAQMELSQFSKITEKWFQLDSEFKRIALKKFLEVCKVAYKENPKRGSFILDDLGQEFIQYSDEFCSTEYDLHIAHSDQDKQLLGLLKDNFQAAIQNGQAKLEDLAAVLNTTSASKVSNKFREASERMAREQEQREAAQAKREQGIMDTQNKALQDERDWKTSEADKEREIKMLKIEADMRLNKATSVDINSDGVKDYEKFAEAQRLEFLKHLETVRSNKAQEALKAKEIQVKKSVPKKP